MLYTKASIFLLCAAASAAPDPTAMDGAIASVQHGRRLQWWSNWGGQKTDSWDDKNDNWWSGVSGSCIWSCIWSCVDNRRHKIAIGDGSLCGQESNE